MKGFVPVFRKELYGMFMSPIFYVVAFFFLLVSGVFFNYILSQVVMASFQLAQHPELGRDFSMMELFLRSFLWNLAIVMLFVAPLLTMRLYAEERKSGTIELLYTYPVTDIATVTAKFAACLTTFVVLLAATLPGVIAVGLASEPAWKLIACGYMGLFLLGCSFLALGIFASTLTRNQIISSIITFAVSLILWFLGEAKSSAGPVAGSILEYVSVSKHFEGLSKGLIDSRDILFYLVFSILFLFLSLRQMSSYRWRG
ncbi:ABC-type transport system involved in multi-copper enzyme maturation, permease component [Syntrophobacter sp. SbD1]|nr:ABC-type transport system involved in multi-copper enzyme maturation, permease component [Syntrophobacter sp. SbD1]